MGRSAKAAKQQKQAKAASRGKPGVDDATDSLSSMSVNENSYPSTTGANTIMTEEQPTTDEILSKHCARTCTGVLSSIPTSRDVKIEQFSMQFHGHKLIDNTTLELTMGRRYGLLGSNGSGKSTFLEVRT
jgi:ATP-binding cassette subfamily F protein 2